MKQWATIVYNVMYHIFIHQFIHHLYMSQVIKYLFYFAAKSPVFGMVSSSLNGIATIRSAGAQNRLIDEFDDYQVSTCFMIILLLQIKLAGLFMIRLQLLYEVLTKGFEMLNAT